ncbi:MAG: DUF2911 domain-containing protein [Vicingaceae bacterium]|nr:DUF2911 domain-containing protein [Vicingaceae bacterium]
MKKMIKIAAMFLVVATTTNVIAQELPQPSPAAKVEQRIGLTDVTVQYSRPSVKERKIFGELVPDDKLWRAGANKNTLITFTDNVKIGGQAINAGTYSMFIIPSATNPEWTVLFNSEIDGWGDGKYDKANDVLKVGAEPKTIGKVESMEFSFNNLKDNSGELILAWDNKAIALKIEVDVEEKAWRNIKSAMAQATDKNKASVYRNSAKYAVASKKRVKEALGWIDESIKAKEYWYTYWVKADVQHALGDNAGAITSAKKAIELGEAGAKESGKPFGYKDRLEKAMAEYK